MRPRSTSTRPAKVTKILAVLGLALLALAQPVAAQTFPALSGRVVDQAGLLRPEQVLDLDSKLAALETQTGRQFVVATVKSLEGRTIEDYGYRLGRTWAIGDKEKDEYADKGLVAVDTALGMKPDYWEAIITKGLLYRVKAQVTRDAKKRKEFLDQAVLLQKQAMDLRKETAAAAAGGTDVPPEATATPEPGK